MWKSRLFYLIGSWTLVLAALQFIPLTFALMIGEDDAAGGFFASASLALSLGGALFLGFRSTEKVRVPRLTIFLPLAGIVALALMAGLPLYFLYPEGGFLRAFYDGMSQITTNGSTAYEGSIEHLRSILLWRGISSWIGGLMAISFTLSLLMAMNSGGLQLHRSPLHYGDRESGYQRLRSTTQALMPVYLFVTMLAFILFWLSGVDRFDALLLALASVSTSGFVPDATVQSLGAISQFLLAIFLVIGLSNWDFHHLRSRKLSPSLRQDRELRMTFVWIAVGFVLLFILTDTTLLDTIALLFAAVSAIATFGIMPSEIAGVSMETALPVAIVLMILTGIGGAVASASGGLKQMRILLIFKMGRAEVDRLAHPHGVHTILYGRATAQKRDIEAIWLLLGSFVFIMALGAISLAVLGIHFQDALTLSFTAMTLSGPLATSADPGFAGYASLASVDYLILSILMLIGRVEAPIFMAVFARALWKG